MIARAGSVALQVLKAHGPRIAKEVAKVAFPIIVRKATERLFDKKPRRASTWRSA